MANTCFNSFFKISQHFAYNQHQCQQFSSVKCQLYEAMYLSLPGRFLTGGGSVIGGRWGGTGRTGDLRNLGNVRNLGNLRNLSFRQERSNVLKDSDLWLRPKVGEVCDHVVEDRVLVGSAGFSSTRSLLLLLLLVCLLRLVGRIRVAACLLLLLLVARRVTGEGVLPGGRVGGVGHTLTGVWLLAVSGVAVCLLWPILVILP